MFTRIQTLLQRQIVRQLLGGIAGAFIALMLYGAYDAASNGLRAMISSPSDHLITDEMRVENIARVAARAREVLEELD
jgi:glycerol uptake facilitator-like aquaporin